MRVIVLMAGEGRRFAESYAIPKPLLLIHDRPMYEWATRSLPFIWHKGQEHSLNHLPPNYLSFAYLYSLEEEHHVKEALRETYGYNVETAILPNPTESMVMTALEVCHLLKIRPREELLFLDCDNHFDGSRVLDSMIDLSVGGSGAFIGVTDSFERTDEWSYALVEGKHITGVAEKDAKILGEGALSIVGVWGFESLSLFQLLARATFDRFALVEGKMPEVYMSDVVQEALYCDILVKALVLKNVVPMGTPDYFEKAKEILKNENRDSELL